MSGAKIVEGAQQAALWAKATDGGRHLPTNEDRAFLQRLSAEKTLVWHDPEGAKVRENCSWYGWAKPSLDGWLLTEFGRIVRDTRVHQPSAHQHAEGDEG